MSMLLRRHYENVSDSGSETTDYSELSLKELKTIAKERGVDGYSDMKKAELIQILG
ncbi:TPA: Rho termination factor N-terminal domain-containing protein [Streptococcus suis]|nr:Rho termination factor N-terminal domain-containing protein [Streptococcus suis]